MPIGREKLGPRTSQQRGGAPLRSGNINRKPAKGWREATSRRRKAMKGGLALSRCWKSMDRSKSTHTGLEG